MSKLASTNFGTYCDVQIDAARHRHLNRTSIMGERERHHIVPRFLLVRFAAEVVEDKSFVWRVPAHGPAKRISTKDAAVQSHFYGQEADGLEAALGDAEGKWGTLLQRIDAGEPLAPLSRELWSFLYLIGWRASPIRSATALFAERFFDHVHDHADDSCIRQGVRRNFGSAWESELEKIVAQLPPQQQSAIRANKHLLGQYAEACLETMDIGRLLRGLVGGVKAQRILPAAAKKGHNQGIAKLLEQDLAPEAVRPVAWTLVPDPDGSVILGDCPVVAVCRTTGETGGLWQFGKQVRAFYLPLSPTQILAGTRDVHVPFLSIAEINIASAAHCEGAFFASRYAESERRLASLAGTRWKPLSDDEVDRIIHDVMTDFGRPAPIARDD